MIEFGAPLPLGLRRVFLRDMVLAASVGVHAFEHAASQRIRINVALDVAEGDPDAAAAGPDAGQGAGGAGSTQGGAAGAEGADTLSRVVDYEAVAGRIRSIVAAGHVRLLETLAERLAGACLEDKRVLAVRVRVEKLDIFTDMVSVGVEIGRQRAGNPVFFPKPA